MPARLVFDYLSDTGSGGPLAGQSLHAAEANHRITNNLSLVAGLLRLQAVEIQRSGEQLSAEAASGLLEEAATRIHTVSRLHRLLANDGSGEGLDMGAYLMDIAEAAGETLAMGSRTQILNLTEDVCTVPSDLALSTGLIVSELITNSIKYAHPSGVEGRISVGCSRGPDGRVMVEVADDGIGLPEGFDADRDGGLGLRLVRSLAQQIGADLEMESGPLGVVAILRLPHRRNGRRNERLL
jgi:two-component sensor histidine kinase